MPVRPELGVPRSPAPGSAAREPRRAAPGSPGPRDPARLASTSASTLPGLGQVRRAGDVSRRRRLAWLPRSPRSSSSRCSWVSVAMSAWRRAASVPRAGGAGCPAQSTARRRAPGRTRPGRQARRCAVGGDRAGGADRGAAPSPASLARCSCTSAASRTAPRSAASPASSLALPPGPAHRSSQARSWSPVSALVSASAASWLASSCTAARCSATAAKGAWVAAGQIGAERRPPRGLRRQRRPVRPAASVRARRPA